MAERINRDAELSTRASVRKKLLDVFKDVEQGFTDQRERADDLLDYWECYNCKLGERQFYQGNSRIFVPIVKNAVKARKTRFTNQIFPQSGRYVEVTTGGEEIPYATMALAEHYVRRANLRTQVVPALCVNGDVEGQYTVYVGWKSVTRHVVSKVTKPVTMDGLEHPDLGEHEDIEEEEIEDAGPSVEVIADNDLLVLPATSDSIEEALENGGSVTVRRRWTKGAVKAFIKDGTFAKDAGEKLLAGFAKRDSPGRDDTPKDLAASAGIRSASSGKYCSGFEVWTKIKVGGELRLTRSYYGGDDIVLGCKLNPYWCDLCPVISTPVDKFAGVLKGRAPLADVIDLQIDANDAANEAADTAHFAAMPIVMTDPEKNPKVGTMVLGLAAVWETDPQSTQFAQFPALWKDGLERISAAKSEIFQTLGVNPAMIAQSTGTKSGKRNQAEIATEQQVDILTTADAVTNLEEGILTPAIQRFIAYDHQFRKDPIVVKKFGEMGLRAVMEEIPPLQWNNRYEYRWFGVEAARNAAQIQQQIATFGVLQKIPPQMYQGYKLKAAPLITQIVENAFGPRLAPLVFEDLKQQLGLDPMLENQLMADGFDMMVHPFDDDQKHIQTHMMVMGTGDPHGTIRAHIVRHQQQMQMKAQAAQQQGGPQQQGGGQGPKPGAQPQGPRLLRKPEGAIHADQMPAAGAVQLPRKM